MIRLLLLLLCISTLLWCCTARAGTAFYVSEYIDGLNKICIYEHYSGRIAITIRSYEVCPVTIEVPDR